MKTIKALFLLFLVLMLFSSCSKNIVINYGPPSPNSGHIELKTTEMVDGNCTLNDSLMVEARNINSITIKNVPSGLYSIHFSGNSRNLKRDSVSYKSTFTITNGRTNTKLIHAQPKKEGFCIGLAGINFINIILMFWVVSGYLWE